jgi:hypothetical protein
MTTLLQSVHDALVQTATINRGVQVPPAAILWTDADGQWAQVVARLRHSGSTVWTLGSYDPAHRQGPAIWLKCAVAGVLDGTELNSSPVVIYLPGVSRTDLRAIDACPRELQPLAELQYRGVFWSQSNGKDWTVNAFMGSQNGGLGLEIAQDKATQEALMRVVQAEEFMELKLGELRDRSINAVWLDSLLAPNPSRDVLAWLNDPELVQGQWTEARWEIFLARCQKEYRFDPIADGVLVAAERLARAQGVWTAVWELYRDAYSSFPQILNVMLRLQAPPRGLFNEWASQAGYPQVNDEAENALRDQLLACGIMSPDQVRLELIRLDEEHVCRRTWPWAGMDRSALTFALQHLVMLAGATVQIPSGDLDALVQAYETNGWQVDHCALQALAVVHSKTDTDAVSAVLHSLYLPWLEAVAVRFQEAVKLAGGLGTRHNESACEVSSTGLCTIFVDGLRYDVARMLKDRLSALGEVRLESKWTCLPSVTASGKAWCSPVARLIAGGIGDQDFSPHIAADGKVLSSQTFHKLLASDGIQYLDKQETGDPSGCAWVECGDLDHYGHEHGIRLARDMDTQLSQIVERIEALQEAGWRHLRIVTDHGWLLLPGGLPKSSLPKHQVETRWGRCAILKDSAHGTPLTFGWSWCSEVQIAFAPGVSNFIAGTEYAHGGLSLQECLVPVLHVEVTGGIEPGILVSMDQVRWMGLRCMVEVSPPILGLHVDIRTRTADPLTSLIAKIKNLENGKANLAILDDSHIGLAAVVVVLDDQGNLIQKTVTTVGG